MAKSEFAEQIADDLELKLDAFFERINHLVLKEIRKLKEDVRDVCVDFPHVPAKVIKKAYLKHTKNMFPEHSSFFADWKKEAEIIV